MKKLFLLGLALLPLTLTGCGAGKSENKLIKGSDKYSYIYVRSQLTGNKYYHISNWSTFTSNDTYNQFSYIGLELTLYASKKLIYYYEAGLSYTLSNEFDANYGKAIE